MCEVDPKTKSSRRRIALVGIALEALKQHRTRQDEMRQAAGDVWEEHGYVFATPIGKHLHPGSSVLDVFRTLLKKAGLPAVRFHDLRHSAATLLLSKGVNPKIVQEILGHSDVKMTMDIYSHVLPTIQQEAIEKLHQIFLPDKKSEDREEENE